MDEVVHRAGVARSSAYRIWPYKGDFVNDLLSTFAGSERGTAGLHSQTRLAATDTVLEHWERLETAEGRKAVTREAIRQAVRQTTDSVVGSTEWEVSVALVATARGNSNDETRQQLAARLESSETSFIKVMTPFYTDICGAIGLKTCGPFTFRHLALVGAAALEGITLRCVLVDANANNQYREPPDDWSLAELVETPLPGPALDGDEPADWSLGAWTFYGVLCSVTEPIPKPTDEHRATVERLNSEARRDIGRLPPPI